jgi:hypothetical protein
VRVPLLLGLLALAAPGPGSTQGRGWAAEHTALAVSSSVALVCDWAQAADASRRAVYEELNLVLGSHPSIGRLRLYNLIVLPGNIGVGWLLPPRLRTIWFAAVTGFETALVVHQFGIGLRLNFRL